MLSPQTLRLRVASLGLASLFMASQAFAQDPALVSMKSISFAPKVLTIKAGQAVIWKNDSLTDHSATANDEKPLFDTEMVKPKASSKAVVFAKTGEFPYHCKLHGRTMSGLIIVR